MAASLLGTGCGASLPDSVRDGAVSSDAAAGGDTTPDAAPVGFFPCDVEAVLKAKCHTCHTQPLKNGAPFPLLEYANTQMPYGTTMRIWQVMKTAVETDYMPFVGSPTGPLEPAQKTTLLTWLGNGAPAASTRCPQP